MASKKEQNKLAKMRIVIGVTRAPHWLCTGGKPHYSLDGNLYTMDELKTIEEANPNVTFTVTK